MDDNWGGAGGLEGGNNWFGDSPTQNGKEKFHLSMLIHALAGAFIASIIGSVIYSMEYNQSGSNVLMVGLVLALIAGGVLLGCAVCELRKPRITMWKELGAADVALGLLVTLLVFGAGCLCEFLYELNSAYTPVVFNDYLFAIDDSESMRDTDPEDLRYSALSELLDTLGSDKRAGLVRFMNYVYRDPIALEYMDGEQKEKLQNEISEHVSEGGTDIYAALEAALELCRDAKEDGRSPVAVLLSDGGSNVPVPELAEEYMKEGVSISTVSLGPGANEVLLQQLAQATGGEYFKVENAKDLVSAFQKVSTAKSYRCLFSPRPGAQRKSVLYMLLRVLFLMLPGALIGVFILLLFRGFDIGRQMIVSLIAGLAAGLVMEIGTFLLLPVLLVHLVSWVLYGIVLLDYEEITGFSQGEFSERDYGVDSMGAFERFMARRQSGDIRRKNEEEGGRIDQGSDW